MTKTQYRALYGAAILLMLSPQAFPSQPGDPEAYWKLLGAVSETNSVARFAMAYVWPAATLVSFYGAFRFRRWAPWLSLALACTNLGVIIAYGASMMLPAPAQALQTLAHYVWGVLMALPFISPDVREMFWPRQANQARELSSRPRSSAAPQ